MVTRFQKPVIFLSGCILSIAAIVLLGAAGKQAGGSRYEADFDTILGGLGGVAVEVTDHDQQKAYLYIASTSRKKEEGPPKFELVATVDLTSAGKPQLETNWVPKKEDEKPARAPTR